MIWRLSRAPTGASRSATWTPTRRATSSSAPPPSRLPPNGSLGRAPGRANPRNGLPPPCAIVPGNGNNPEPGHVIEGMDTTTYIVAATLPDGTRRLVMDDIPNYDEAVEIWHRLDAERDPDRVRVYCVRSEDDPAWHGLLRVDADINRRAYTAQRDARNAELARTIRWALREGGCRSFDQVVADVTRSLRDRGYHVPAHWQIEAAVKNRVTVARCRKDGKYDRDHCDRAWFWPRREGTLGEHACPTCGGDLSQTSLAYGQQFHRITKQEPARRVAEPNAGLLSAQTGTYKAGE